MKPPMPPRAAALGSVALHYFLAYTVALPLFVLFLVARAVRARVRRLRALRLRG
jgi:hypothetical protein